MHPPHLHLRFRVALGFVLTCRLTHLRMPDAIPIRRISGLPPASFRFHLAMDTLAIGYVLGATSCTRDFHPLERAHAGRTTTNPRDHLVSGAIDLGKPGSVLLSLEIQPTIIGPKAFHCPVRNGKEWYHFGMAARLRALSVRCCAPAKRIS